MNGLLFITHRTERYSYLESVKIALEGGCRQIQLRMKDADPAEIGKTGTEAKALCEKYGAQLFIDDHVEICKKIQATGVHLGKTDMPPEKARTILGNDFMIGGTANTLEDIEHLARAGVDYIGLGPFRFTSTKKNLSPILGIEGYRQLMAKCREQNIHLPVLAIGGITAEDIPSLMETGISGIALSSSILNTIDPVNETRKIINTINQYQLWKN